MARPTRCRRVCEEPVYQKFSPCGESNVGEVVLTVDEYEVIRLVDYEKRTHEQCAEQMEISRTTVTEIYERARYKISDSLIHGKTLLISGGHYRICREWAGHGCGRHCPRQRPDSYHNHVVKKGESSMRIAVTFENGKVFQHFGHTEQFKLVDAENGQISGEQIVSASGSGHGALAGFLSGLNVDVLICGGIGGGAQSALAENGIKLYGGVSGDVDEAVKNFLAGTLQYDANVHCDHHGHHHEHHHGHEHHGHCGENRHGCGG